MTLEIEGKYATPAEIKAMKKSMAEVTRRRKKYPECKHPSHRVRPLVPGHSYLWCSLCWEAWEPPTTFGVTVSNTPSTITIPLGNAETISSGA